MSLSKLKKATAKRTQAGLPAKARSSAKITSICQMMMAKSLATPCLIGERPKLQTAAYFPESQHFRSSCLLELELVEVAVEKKRISYHKKFINTIMIML